MKKTTILLCLSLFVAISCNKDEQETQILNLTFTPCNQQDASKENTLSGNVDVVFTNAGVQITYYDFMVTCDFTTVNVSHTFENGVLNITQQGYPNQTNCICYTDVSYTINGISQNEVNVILINGEQVYCHNDAQSNCDQDVIISPLEYENAPDHPVSIVDMEIVGDCLKIEFSSSGCNGESWVVKLIDMGIVAESNPCQRVLRLSLDNQEACLAMVNKEMSFNIEDLQIYGANSVLLNVSGTWILYEY